METRLEVGQKWTRKQDQKTGTILGFVESGGMGTEVVFRMTDGSEIRESTVWFSCGGWERAFIFRAKHPFKKIWICLTYRLRKGVFNAKM